MHAPTHTHTRTQISKLQTNIHNKLFVYIFSPLPSRRVYVCGPVCVCICMCVCVNVCAAYVEPTLDCWTYSFHTNKRTGIIELNYNVFGQDRRLDFVQRTIEYQRARHRVGVCVLCVCVLCVCVLCVCVCVRVCVVYVFINIMY